MALTRPFAYNSGSIISETTQYGNLAVGENGTYDFSTRPGNVTWYMGPDENEKDYIFACVNEDQKLPVFYGCNGSGKSFATMIENMIKEFHGESISFTSAADAAAAAEEYNIFTSNLPPTPVINLLFDYIDDPPELEDLNSFFELPEYGNPFIDLMLDEYKLILIGGYNIILKSFIFGFMDNIVSFEDTGCCSEIQEGAFYYCTSLTSVILSDFITTIPDRAFFECNSLTGITIPNSVTTIGEQAFSSCRSFTNITIPNSVTVMKYGAFGGCDSLTDITISNSITTIEMVTFYGCNSLTGITIPNSVTTIKDNAFNGCRSLTDITIPNSVTTIKKYAFFNCISLTGITIPDSVTTIGDAIFYNCPSLTSINVSEYNLNYKSINGILFSKNEEELSVYPANYPGTEYIIPNSVTTIGAYAFSYCKLTGITIPNSVTTIGAYAFSYCQSITGITIPDSVTTIGDHAFARCSSLTTVTIGSSIQLIDQNAFFECWALESIYMYSEIAPAAHGYNSFPNREGQNIKLFIMAPQHSGYNVPPWSLMTQQ